MDENTLPQRFFIIRPFMKGDETACKQIIGESIMSSMGRTFTSALFRETTFQLMIFMSAILFIIVGIPFHYCVISVPLTILGLYFVVWSSLLMKSLEAQHEMSLIKQQYQQTDKTNFWIAEYYGPMIDFDPKAHTSRLCTEDIKGLENQLSGRKRRVVGLMGLQRNKERACKIWLRRLAVTSDMKRKHVATELLNKACHFCYERGYSSVETCITECQVEGREFLMGRGFELEQLYHKRVIGSSAVYTKYLFRKDLLHSKSALNA